MDTVSVLEAWDGYAAGHLKRSTAQLYRLFAKQLFDHSKVPRLRELTRRHVEAWKAHELKTCTPRSVNNKLRQAHSVVVWAIEYFDIPMTDPFVGVRRCREVKRLPRYLSDADVARLMIEAKRHSRDAHIGFALMVYAGLRKGEVAHARWEWVDWQRSTLLVQPVYVDGALVWEPKNQGSINETPLHPRLRKILDSYRSRTGWMLAPSKEVSSQYRYRWDWKGSFATVCKRAGLEWVTPHVLRHTLASNMVRAGYTMRQVQAVLRHSDPRSTAVYAHLEGKQVDLSRVFE